MLHIILKFFSYHRRQWFKRKKNILYSALIRPEFKKIGTNNIFEGFGDLIGAKYISIGSHCTFQNYFYLTAWDKYGNDIFHPEITIGNNVSLGAFNHITCVNKIIIGNPIQDNKHTRRVGILLLKQGFQRMLLETILFSVIVYTISLLTAKLANITCGKSISLAVS